MKSRMSKGDGLKRRVVFVLQDLGVGGAQRHTIGLVRDLRPRFDLVAVAHASGISPGIVGPDVMESVLVLGQSGLLNPLKWVRIGRAIASLKPDLVVSINQIASILIFICSLLGLLRCPRAVIFHTTDVRDSAGWIRTIPFFPAVWASDCLIYISANQARLWKARGLFGRRTETIRNGIDHKSFRIPDAETKVAARSRLGLDVDDFVIGMSAVLRSEKNHLQMVEALAILRRDIPKARLLLIGDGPMRPEIEKRVGELGLGPYVLFAGMQNDVRPFLDAVDVGVLCSTAVETLSLSALEAMAMGIPMVMSDIGGASEIVYHGENGFLFQAGDTPALVAALAECAPASRREVLSRNAAATVARDFRHEKMLESYVSLFESLFQKK